MRGPSAVPVDIRSSEGLSLNGGAKRLAHPSSWYDDAPFDRSSMLDDHEAVTGEERLCGPADIRSEVSDFVLACLIVQGDHEQTADALPRYPETKMWSMQPVSCSTRALADPLVAQAEPRLQGQCLRTLPCAQTQRFSQHLR